LSRGPARRPRALGLSPRHGPGPGHDGSVLGELTGRVLRSDCRGQGGLVAIADTTNLVLSSLAPALAAMLRRGGFVSRVINVPVTLAECEGYYKYAEFMHREAWHVIRMSGHDQGCSAGSLEDRTRSPGTRVRSPRRLAPLLFATRFVMTGRLFAVSVTVALLGLCGFGLAHQGSQATRTPDAPEYRSQQMRIGNPMRPQPRALSPRFCTLP
jgi:hypothetical protein